jgi:cytochrome bd-type quinol oxidase subunit 2
MSRLAVLAIVADARVPHVDVRQRARQRRHRPGVIPIGALVVVAAVGGSCGEKLDGWAFLATGLAIVLITATMFLNLYPRDALEHLGGERSRSGTRRAPTTPLTVMTWIA